MSSDKLLDLDQRNLKSKANVARPLVDRYRPKEFVDVLGQDVPVRYLSGLILRGQACRNILLHGSIGSGKTTLARIYAKALNCESPSRTDGSPCLACKSCQSIEDGLETVFTELDAPRFAKLGDLNLRIRNALGADLRPDARRVIFIDEAHSLKSHQESADFLLKLVEEPPVNTSFCFATTAPEKMEPALVSRCVSLRLRPLSLGDGIEYLGNIAEREGVRTEREALALIVGLGDGQPRNMLQALDQVSDGGNAARLKVTRESVIDMFGVSRTEYLCRYMEALGSGDFIKQTKIFFSWQESVQTKVRLIQAFLLSLYYNRLCSIGLSIDPLIAAIRPDEYEPAIEAFRCRLGLPDLKPFWEDMMAVLPAVTPMLGDEALLTYVIELQRVANRSSPVPRPLLLPDRVPEGRAVRSERVRSVRASSARSLVRIPKLKRDPRYLTLDNVAQLIRASSFVVQEYGVQFNARITIQHGKFGCKNQDEAAEHFAEFSKALDSRLKAWTGYGHRICAQEVDEAVGFCGRIVASVPNDLRFPRWSERWGNRILSPGEEDTSIIISLESAGNRLDAHWRCVRWLCGGLDPRTPEADLLKIEPEFRRVAGDIGQRTRMPISDSLKGAGIKKAEEALALEALSAFDDGAWDRLYDGWELDEHLSRERHKRHRSAEVEELVRRYGPLDIPEMKASMEAELSELRAAWPDKYSRERLWSLWRRA